MRVTPSAQWLPWRTLTIAVVLCAVSDATSAQSYNVVELGVLPGQVTSTASDINNRFQIVGYSGDEVFLWEPETGMRPLGIQAAPIFPSLMINDNGVIAGTRLVDGRTELFAWINGQVYRIPDPPGDQLREAGELTNNNILLAYGQQTQWALIGATFVDLKALFSASIFSINETGAVGGVLAGNGYVRYPDGREITLDQYCWVDRIGPAGHFAASYGFRIKTIGSSWICYGLPDGTYRRIVTSNDSNGAHPSISRITRSGDLVGTDDVGFVFLVRAGNLIQLSQLASASAMNDAGFIVGSAIVDGSRRARLLVPAGASLPSAPAAPSRLTYAVSGRVVSLAWAASAGTTNYLVEAGSAPSLRDLFFGGVGNQTSFASAAPPGLYYVRIRAANAFGVSGPSEEVVIDTR